MNPLAVLGAIDHKLRIWMPYKAPARNLTELYMKYSEGVPQQATQYGAKSSSGATGFAGWQAGAVRRLWRG
jgi:hypothetical protein